MNNSYNFFSIYWQWLFFTTNSFMISSLFYFSKKGVLLYLEQCLEYIFQKYIVVICTLKHVHNKDRRKILAWVWARDGYGKWASGYMMVKTKTHPVPSLLCYFCSWSCTIKLCQSLSPLECSLRHFKGPWTIYMFVCILYIVCHYINRFTKHLF